jgi:glycosyltransferase involved in cell wall biosynthesis
MEISVIITNFNYERFLARAIRSVVNQSIEKNSYEVIVIDDCSTDSSKKTIELFSSSDHIRPIFNEKNMGLAASCNKAIKEALGKYIIRVDADDYIHTDCLKLHKLFLENNKNDMDATSSDYYEVDLQEGMLKRKNGVTWPIACGIMYKTDHIFDIGMYDETLPREDVDFRKRFIKKYQIYNIPIPLYRYTIHTESMTRNEDAKNRYV